MNQNEPGGSSRLSCGLLCDGGNMEITLCATQSHLATAWRDRIGSRLAATVRVVEGDILSLGVTAVVSPANSFGFMDAGLESVAIPGMGTGTGGLAPREAAAAMLWGIRDALYPPAFPASLADVLSF